MAKPETTPRMLIAVIDELNTKHQALRGAAFALLARIDNITTEDFSKGGDRQEREALRELLLTR